MGAIAASVRSCLRPCASSVLARRGAGYPASLALLWRDAVNAKPLHYITYNGKYLVVKNV